MKITAISVQARDKNRVNVFVDGTYRFSLAIAQVADLGIKVGKEYTDAELLELEQESQFGKLYTRTLEYCFARPHSRQEVEQYLYRKTRPQLLQKGGIKPGVSPVLTRRVFDRLDEKGYLNDTSFARYWIENRQMRKGISRRKLQAELRAKGVAGSIIDSLLAETERTDEDELQKIIAKKARRYDDQQKFMAYLARQGFSYDDIKAALSND